MILEIFSCVEMVNRDDDDGDELTVRESVLEDTGGISNITVKHFGRSPV